MNANAKTPTAPSVSLPSGILFFADNKYLNSRRGLRKTTLKPAALPKYTYRKVWYISTMRKRAYHVHGLPKCKLAAGLSFNSEMEGVARFQS